VLHFVKPKNLQEKLLLARRYFEAQDVHSAIRIYQDMKHLLLNEKHEMKEELKKWYLELIESNLKTISDTPFGEFLVDDCTVWNRGLSSFSLGSYSNFRGGNEHDESTIASGSLPCASCESVVHSTSSRPKTESATKELPSRFAKRVPKKQLARMPRSKKLKHS